MSFVGLVTQKEVVTGVNLMAKVVTANKKKSAKKVFPVRVKPSVLDDYSCCIIDLAATVDKLNASQNLSEIIDNIVLVYNGEHDTTISYVIKDREAPFLSDYLLEDGKVAQRPKYGEGDAAGTLEITVSKGKEKIVSNIEVCVKETTAEEVLADATLTQAGLWSAIRGKNDSYNNISGLLNFITTKTITEKSVEPVNIAWSVVDSTLGYTTLYEEPRINVTNGVITRPSYEEACALIGTIPGVITEIVGTDNTSSLNRVRIGGITLTATVTLGDAVKAITFNCATISKYLTNAEISKVIENNLKIYGSDGREFLYRNTGNNQLVHTITAPPEGGTYTLTAYGDAGSETFAAPNLKLNVGDITNVSINNQVNSFTNPDEAYPDAALFITAFGNGFNVDNDVHNVLTIDFDAIKSATDEKKKFVIKSFIDVGSYSATGETSGGQNTNMQRHAYFIIDTSAITTNPASEEE